MTCIMMVRIVVGVLSVSAVPVPSEPPTSRPATRTPSACLRLAHSSDGVTFEADGRVLVDGATSPGLVRLPNGLLLAIFDLEGDAGLPRVSRSTDDGKTWSSPQRIRLQGAGQRVTAARHPELIVLSQREVRVYLTAGPLESRHGRDDGDEQPAVILTGISRNGLDYRLDGEIRLDRRRELDVHTTAVRIRSQTHLYVQVLKAGVGESATAGELRHFVSMTGRRFRELEPVRSGDVQFAGSLVALRSGYVRAYLAGADGIRSALSNDGKAFIPEAGLRMGGGTDATVVQLKDETWLMIYATKPVEGATSRPILARSAENRGGSALDSERGESGKQQGGVDWGALGADADASGGGLADMDASLRDASAGGLGDAFAPQPYFTATVDYVQWAQAHYPTAFPGNAYDLFAAIEPEFHNPAGVKPAGWPDGIDDMFNGEYSGPIAPWDPTERPAWEQTHQAFQPFLSMFSEATWAQHYACPLNLDNEYLGAIPDGHKLLLGAALPSLAVNRAWVKASMADAWRMEDGQVDPQKMLNEWGASLRNAALMNQGATLVHQLVGIAEQGLVQDNALAALKHNVFKTPEALEAALVTLAQNDYYHNDPSWWMPLEHASAMDVLQYVFTPADAEGEPQVNVERMNWLLNSEAVGWWADGHRLEEMQKRVQTMTAGDAREIVDLLDSYYRELAQAWTTGYPVARSADMKALQQRYEEANPLIGGLIPSLGRAYFLMNRIEASRRATQLSYAVHIFKARQGRWPVNLAELPPEHAYAAVDPFTGGYFGYQHTGDGVKIYSLGEDGVDDGGAEAPHISVSTDLDYVFWPSKR